FHYDSRRHKNPAPYRAAVRAHRPRARRAAALRDAQGDRRLRRADRVPRAAQEAQGERRDAVPPPQGTRDRGPDRNRPPGKIRQSPSQPRRAARVSRSFGENLTALPPLQNCGPHHSSTVVELSKRWQGTRIMRGLIRAPTEQEKSMSDLKGKVAIVTGASK